MRTTPVSTGGLDHPQLLNALIALKRGDFSVRMPLDHTGIKGKIADTLNEVLDRHERLTKEIHRISAVVGKEGKTNQRAAREGFQGSWASCIDAVNTLVVDLVQPTSEVARVIGAVAQGDLNQTMALDIDGRSLTGEFLRTAKTINTMVAQLNAFSSEVTRVAREVGTEGKLGGQAEVKGVAGTWKDLTESVNFMASNLTSQVRNIAEVTTAVATGDLSKKITADAKGEILEVKSTVNTMVDQLNAFASEVTRVAREVGTEGKLGGQAEVKGVAGTWKDLTDNVNFMASNLTGQVRNIAEVATAIATGDLSKKITADAKGEILELKNTINIMLDRLNAFASEVTRVAREVGTEGKLGGQAAVPGVAGTWKDLTDNVNFMASNLTGQVRNIAEVATAIATGDLSKKITADAKGEILDLKNTINIMLDQLNAFASEVTRVAREVGTEGKLGGQADVKGVAGTWKDLTDNVNFMASNLTGQVRNIAEVSTAIAKGDLSRKITVDVRGEILELKNTINTMVDQLNAFASEVTRVAREVGTEGRLGGQADVRDVSGTWKDLTDNVNFMASNLTGQVRNIAEVATSIANGDLSRKITVDVRGEILGLKNTVNTMVDQLNSFASEVTRVAREVGTEGKLGGQAMVKGVSGTWKDLTDNMNFMASNLTGQVRNIARVVTAVATGELRLKLVLEAKGEIAELADTINAMIDTLATFADQVTTVAREVGIEGKLGGQASVPGAAGTWRDLTDNVNRLAANLTTQVRAIAEVATAVTTGDLSRSVNVEAAGEVAVLKDNINQMIRNLADTTRINTEQDWLKTNVARFTRLLQGQRDLLTVSRLILSELAPLVSVQHGLFYFLEEAKRKEPVLKLQASYGFQERKHLANRFRASEGLVGQCMLERQRILLTHVPENYIKIVSGLGEGTPRNIVVIPVLFEGEVLAVIELATFDQFSPVHLTFLDQLTESIGIVLNTLQANSRTEELLKQSQSLTQELQNRQLELQQTNERLEQQAKSLQVSEERLREQQEELSQTNVELEDKAKLLAEQNREVEHKNRQIEVARQELEEKAEQLTLSSKYKSEFLANMSHELRTPLNSMLVLSQILAENSEGNLGEKQKEYAMTIHSSGTDLLTLINEVLDLAKIEAGHMDVHIAGVPFSALHEYVERTFREPAREKGIEFAIELDPALPKAIYTDSQRLEQILRNLVSNAFKFTAHGQVVLRIGVARAGWSHDQDILNRAETVIAFSVRDTGIGISIDRQKLVFEAFQQADGTTSRKFGGTGLGLSISREIAALLGGEIGLVSAPGTGSTFTLYLPLNYAPRPEHRAPPDTRSYRERLSLAAEQAMIGAGLGDGAAEPLSSPDLMETADDTIADDREQITPADRVLLIVEDDPAFARIMHDRAHLQGFKTIVSSRGAPVLDLARRFQPAAITLDMRLPDTSGWILLDRLKHHVETRHIPVQIISVDPTAERGRRLGALAWLEKPVNPEELDDTLGSIKTFVELPVKRVLIREDDGEESRRIVELLGNSEVQTRVTQGAEETITALNAERYDCLVIDAGLKDAFELMGTLRESTDFRRIPVLLYQRKPLTRRQRGEIKRLAKTLFIDSVKTLEHLVYKITLLLHRHQDGLSASQQQLLAEVARSDPELSGKKVLIVDDDPRNVFAVTSLLERHHMEVLYADSGRAGIEALEKAPDIDLVIMDVMMPEMDGYETMRRLRADARFKSLPIIALTAKAMKGDRDLCMAAGASDYIAKPVDNEQLLSMLRVWSS